MKRKDSNCVVTSSDQGEAATASNVSEYTINRKLGDLGQGPPKGGETTDCRVLTCYIMFPFFPVTETERATALKLNRIVLKTFREGR